MKDIVRSARNRKDFWDVDAARTNLKPFPGRWPTRWRLSLVDNKEKLVFQYIGKPNHLLIAKIERLKKQFGYALLQEFDQLGPFRECSRGTPCRVFNISTYNATVCFAYYPWSIATGPFFQPWDVEMYPARIYWGKGNNRRSLGFYSPFPNSMATEAGAQRCRDFHSWLRKQNVFK